VLNKAECLVKNGGSDSDLASSQIRGLRKALSMMIENTAYLTLVVVTRDQLELSHAFSHRLGPLQQLGMLCFCE
jgi:hypothetical protein